MRVWFNRAAFTLAFVLFTLFVSVLSFQNCTQFGSQDSSSGVALAQDTTPGGDGQGYDGKTYVILGLCNTDPNAVSSKIVVSTDQTSAYLAAENCQIVEPPRKLARTEWQFVSADQNSLQYANLTFVSQTTLAHQDPFWSQVVLLIKADVSNIISDSSAKAHPLPIKGAVKVDHTLGIFASGSSLLFSGNPDALKLADDVDWTWAADFTVDLWIRPAQIKDTQEFLGSNRTRLKFDQTDGLVWDPNGCNLRQGDWTGWNVNTWYHVALVRSGTIVTLYRDGVAITSKSCTDVYDPSELDIGRKSDGSNYFKGNMDALRITKDVARWTTNFTPPTYGSYE